jgi:hypothetical protein
VSGEWAGVEQGAIAAYRFSNVSPGSPGPALLMRIVVDRGRHPGSVLPYLLRTDKREKGREDENPILHTNMFGCTVEELTEEFRFSADQNGRVERTYVQYKVSFPPGENPDWQTKVGVVDDLLELQEPGRGCQFLAIEQSWGLRACSPKPKGLRVNTSIREVKLKEQQGQSLVKDRLRAVLEVAG